MGSAELKLVHESKNLIRRITSRIRRSSVMI